LRKFTSREYACLQTFPVDYEFSKKEVVKQIGNAVPPMLSQAIYRAVIKSLRKTDEAELRAAQVQGQSQAERMVISLL
jgi:DNA (cytosine-5)-methyltransferase 1